jgi:hypothetical protein
MPYPPQYSGHKYTAPTSCQSCGDTIPDESTYNAHFSHQGLCANRGYDSIDHYINQQWPTWVAAQKTAKPVVKGLHWKGKVWKIATCLICKREKQAVCHPVKLTVGGIAVNLMNEGSCRLCIQTIADALDKISSEMNAAVHGGEKK